MEYNSSLNFSKTADIKPQITDLLHAVMEHEAKEQARYKEILKTACSDKQKQCIEHLLRDEEKHARILDSIYMQLHSTLDFDLPASYDFTADETDLLAEELNEELSSIKFYRELRRNLTASDIRDLISGIILDEQAHAARLGTMNPAIFSKREETLSRQNRVTATSKAIRSSSAYIQEDLVIPVLQGIQSPSLQKTLNENIENDIIEFKRQMEEAAQEAGTQAVQTGRRFTPYSISSRYDITYNRNNILSLSILYQEFIGGKQVYIRSTYNYDLDSGRSLSLEDLFRQGVDYRTIINQEIRRQLQASPAAYPSGAAASFKGIAADQPFYLEGNYLVIFLSFNEFASSLNQIPVIRIPLASIRGSLRRPL